MFHVEAMKRRRSSSTMTTNKTPMLGTTAVTGKETAAVLALEAFVSNFDFNVIEQDDIKLSKLAFDKYTSRNLVEM